MPPLARHLGRGHDVIDKPGKRQRVELQPLRMLEKVLSHEQPRGLNLAECNMQEIHVAFASGFQ